MSHSLDNGEQRPFCSRQLFALVAAREEMSVRIGGHDDGRVAETLLHRLDRQFQAAVAPPIDAPRSEEVPQGMDPGIFRPVRGVDNASEPRPQRPRAETAR